MRRRERLLKKYGAAKEDNQKPEEQSQNTGSSRNIPLKFLDKNHKALLLVPLILLVAAIILIAVQTITTGDFVNKGISLKGGMSITAPSQDMAASDLEQKLTDAFPDSEIIVRSLEDSGNQVGLAAQANILPEETEKAEAFKQKVSELTGFEEEDLSIETIGAALGAAFFKQTMIAILIAFIFMSLVVFMYFKTFVPSMAVVLAALSDIVITVAVINLLDFQIGTAGIAALLMLIGYSVDTDILLSTRVLKGKSGTTHEKIVNAMKTGLTMTGTTLAVVVVTLIVAESAVLREIMFIILIGLIVDIINTWLQNAAILRIYMDKKEGNNGQA